MVANVDPQKDIENLVYSFIVPVTCCVVPVLLIKKRITSRLKCLLCLLCLLFSFLLEPKTYNLVI